MRFAIKTSPQVLHQRCGQIGRDPEEILISTHLRVDVDDPAAIEAQVTAAQASVLEPLAG